MRGDEPGGVFIDIARSGNDFALVLHRLGMDNWLTPVSPPWTPLRGQVVFAGVTPIETALPRLYSAIADVREFVSENDRIRGWGYPFPHSALRTIGNAIGMV